MKSSGKCRLNSVTGFASLFAWSSKLNLRNKVCFPNQAKIILLIIIVVFFLVCNVQHANASRLLDASGEATYSDNATNAATIAGKKSDTVYSTSLAGGRHFQVADYTGLSLMLDAKKEISAGYAGLSLLSYGISFKVSHKAGLGPSALRLNMYGSVSNDDYGDKYRDSLSYRAGVFGSRWVNEEVKLGIGYEYDKRNPLNKYTVTSCTGAYYATCNQYSSPSVYELQGHTGILNAEVMLTDKDILFISYRYRSGDVVSVDAASNKALSASSASSDDEVFTGLTAYRLPAITHTGSIGISHELARKISLNFNYSFVATMGSGGNDYLKNLFSIVAAFSF